jgi:hypothetical protein
VSAILKRKHEVRERARRSFRAEHEYRMKVLDKFVADRIDKIGRSDERAYFAAQRERQRRPWVFVKGVM